MLADTTTNFVLPERRPLGSRSILVPPSTSALRAFPRDSPVFAIERKLVRQCFRALDEFHLTLLADDEPAASLVFPYRSSFRVGFS